MKKSILLVLVLALLTTGLTGFGIAEQAEPVTLSWFINYSALPSNWNMNEPIFAGITEATGVQCTFNIPAEDPDTKLNLLMVSGDMPDLITISNGTLISDMIEADMVWNLDELYATYMPDSWLATSFPKDLKEALITRDSGWYAYPSHMITDDASEYYGYVTEDLRTYWRNAKYDLANAIYLYRPVVEQMNIDVNAINTEAELLDVLARISEANLTNENGASVYTVMTDGIWTTTYSINQTLAYTFGAMPVSDDGHYQSLYYSDEYRDAVKFLNKCAQAGYITDTQLIMDEPSVVSITNSGRCACWIGSLATLKSGADITENWLSLGTVISDRGSTPVMPYNANVSTGWLSTFVSKKCANPEAAARFMDYMSSPEGMKLHMYGVEGVDYTIDEQGYLARTDEGKGKIEDSISGNFGFYAFHNTAFSRSIEWVDTTKVSQTMIYGACDNVVIYDSSVFDLPSGYVEAGSDMAFIQTETGNCIDARIPTIILAQDDATFDELYNAFLAELDSLGRRDYDAYIDEQVQKNCEAKGIELKPVN